MNERIFELAKTSGAWDYFNDGDKSAIMDQQALQNFAMDVVKECRNAISELDVDSPEATIALLMADGAIRSRFRVNK
jgi:hypothetical protein